MSSNRSQRLIGLLGLGLILVAMWSYAIARATTPDSSGQSLVEALSEVPRLTAGSPDTALYYHIIRRVHSGEGYYQASAGVLALNNAVDPAGVNLGSPLSHRPPAMYWLLSLLPPTGIAYICVTLAVGSMGSVAAFLLARRYAVLPLALASAALVALYYAGMANSVAQLGTEVWAGAFGLLSVALLVRTAHTPGSRRIPGSMWGAAFAAFAASLVRELGVAFVIVGLAATLGTPAMRRSGGWLPWMAALFASAVAFAVHLAMALSWLGAPSTGMPAFPWLAADGSGLLAGAVRAAGLLRLPMPIAWALIGLGLLGAVLAPRTRSERIALLTTVVGGAIVLALFHPPGTGVGGLPPGYWADLVLPSILACVPLALLVVPSTRSTRTNTSGTQASATGVSIPPQ